MNALGSPDGEGPGGVFVLDGKTFDVRGCWEMDRCVPDAADIR